MQYIDDNMDELFRKAAENYPLKTDSKNWSAVEKGLQDQNIVTKTPIENNNKYRRFLWLLLLLPLLFICTRYFNSSNKEKLVETAPKQTENAQQNSSKKPGDAEQNKKAETKPVSNETLASGKQANTENSENTSTTIAARQQARHNYNNKNVLRTNTNILKQNNLIPQHQAPETQTATEPNKQSAAIDELNKSNQQSAVKPGDDISITQAMPNAKDSVALTANDTSKVKNVKKIKTPQPVKKGFYAGVIGGMDVSTIKLQQVKKTGYSLGLLIGYRFNKNISAETGLLWDKKNYYTDGKYFNKTRTNIPYNVWIKEMDGYCNMYELPINFRYDVLHHNNKQLFAIAGFSTYFMKKEDYDYTAEANGNWYSGSHTYKNSTTNWFGILNLSAGYEVPLFNLGNFRVEPYLKVPLKGLGIGSMPILSGGINVGITRSLK